MKFTGKFILQENKINFCLKIIPFSCLIYLLVTWCVGGGLVVVWLVFISLVLSTFSLHALTPDTNINHLHCLFTECGTIKNYFPLSTPTRTIPWTPSQSPSAHIVFTDPQAIKNISKLAPQTWTDSYNDDQPQLYGLSKYVHAFQQLHPSIDEISQSVNKTLENFDIIRLERQKELEKKARMPDEDGFITVIRKHTQTDDNGNARKRKKTELVDFYRFQMKETKMKQLQELRRKFEVDKEKIQKMKLARKFKPM